MKVIGKIAEFRGGEKDNRCFAFSDGLTCNRKDVFAIVEVEGDDPMDVPLCTKHFEQFIRDRSVILRPFRNDRGDTTSVEVMLLEQVIEFG